MAIKRQLIAEGEEVIDNGEWIIDNAREGEESSTRSKPALELSILHYQLPTMFIDVVLEPDEELAEDLYLRFKLVAGTQTKPVSLVRYTSDEGVSGDWQVKGRAEQGAFIRAAVSKVEDSSAGVSMLVMGGIHGVLLSLVGGSTSVVLPYLLLSEEDILG